jgi:hypothetical protein
MEAGKHGVVRKLGQERVERRADLLACVGRN